MKKNQWLLAFFLFLCLSVVAILLISADASKPTDITVNMVSQLNIQITEICAKNESIIADNNGKYSDYIELHNSGDAISLSGYTLYDGKNKSKPIGDIVLGPDEYRVFFVSRGETGFAIGASGGDTIQLLDPIGRIVAQANVDTLQADEVMLWRNGKYVNSFEASPGFANNAVGLKAFRQGNEISFGDLVISEVLIDNVSALPDEKGIYSDIVELHNVSDTDIDLSDYFLSDSLLSRFGYRLPDMVLQSGSYVLLYCDGENYISQNGEIHTNFGLAQGEDLVLTGSNGDYTVVPLVYLGENMSWSLGDDGQFFSYEPTLGFSNDSYGAQMLYESRINANSALVINELLLSSAGVPYNGSFCDVVEIANVMNEPVNTAGWYLSDGGDPYEYPLPEQTLEPGETLVIVCGPTTTGFSLSEGESLVLTGTDYMHAQPVLCIANENGLSISRVSDGENIAYSFMDVTLGYADASQSHTSFLQDQMRNDLRISEMMSNNQMYLLGAYQTNCDWIEFYNASDTEIRLSDYYLSDRKGNTTKYQLPDRTLAPGAYIVILLKEDPTNLIDGYDVLPGNLSSEGETLYLSKNGEIIDYVLLPELAQNMSYGREAGTDMFKLLERVTPGSANSVGVEKAALPVAVTAQGVYNDVDYVDVILNGEGKIYYTTNCTEPGTSSTLYNGPIRLSETTVIRAICCQDGKLPSEVLDLTYVINEYDNLPVLSMVVLPDDLWNNETGIYVMGDHAEEEEPYRGANFWMNWEKKASLSLFENDGSGFSVNCGVKIFGGFTRAQEKKSFACLFRDIYGAGELDYSVFGEEGLDTFEGLVLRTAGQDAFKAKMRDVVITSLVSEYTDLPVQNYKATVLYINGRYWGLYYIREKLNEQYLYGHYNISPDEATIVELAGWTYAEYVDLLRYTANHDMSVQENYDYVCSKINVDNYIDFFIAQMWIGNSDNGNVRYFLNEEGKWTWIFYDTDISFEDSSKNFVASNLREKGIGAGDVTCKTFAVKLIENKDFRDKFLTRMAWQMNTIWTEENVIGRIDEIVDLIDADMTKETNRWYSSYERWTDEVELMRQFARERNKYMLQHIQEYFGLSDKEMRAYGFNV